MPSTLAPFISSLWNAIEAFPDAHWKSALSQGQLNSKEWLIEKANDVFKNKTFCTAFVIGGWYGLLPALWKQSAFCPVHKFRSVDIDNNCWKIAEAVNKKWVIDDWQFKATTADALLLDYKNPKITVTKNGGDTLTLHESPDLIINTCCEHFSNLSQWLNKIPQGTPLILQSNNFTSDPQHVFTHDSLQEFEQSTSLSQVLYSGELQLDHYTRYMIIGIK